MKDWFPVRDITRHTCVKLVNPRESDCTPTCPRCHHILECKLNGLQPVPEELPKPTPETPEKAARIQAMLDAMTANAIKRGE